MPVKIKRRSLKKHPNPEPLMRELVRRWKKIDKDPYLVVGYMRGIQIARVGQDRTDFDEDIDFLMQVVRCR